MDKFATGGCANIARRVSIVAMDAPTKIGLFLAIFGLAASLFFGFAPYEWRGMPRMATRSGLVVSGILAIVAFAVLFFAPGVEYPDVTLSFVESKEPDIQLHNLSNVVAENIKWSLIIFDLDTTSRHDPLPIPASIIDFLAAKTSSLPIALFSRPQITPLVKPGDVIFGSASVNCPRCSRGRTFWVYIKIGSGGWYSEVKSVTKGNLVSVSPTPYVAELVQDFVKTIPESGKIPIQDIKQERLSN